MTDPIEHEDTDLDGTPGDEGPQTERPTEAAPPPAPDAREHGAAAPPARGQVSASEAGDRDSAKEAAAPGETSSMSTAEHHLGGESGADEGEASDASTAEHDVGGDGAAAEGETSSMATAEHEISGEEDAEESEDAKSEPTDPPSDENDPTAVEMETVDPEATVNLTGDFDATVNLTGDPALSASERDDAAVANEVTRGHLKGLLEALIFASDKPIKAGDLAKSATAPVKQVKQLLEELRTEYGPRGMQLDEVAGGWIFRTNAAYAPFVRDLTKQKPVKLTRAQIETLAILAYRQPITRPEVDDIRGVDCGPVLKVLLDRDLVRMLGKKDEPGRPWLYGTTSQFLEFFGLKSLRDLPTLREFTDLNEESRRTVEKELGETLESVAEDAGALSHGAEPEPVAISSDTLPPGMMDGSAPMNTEIPPAMPGNAGANAADREDPDSMEDPVELDDERGAEPADDLETTIGDTPHAARAEVSPGAEEGEGAALDPEEEFPDDDDDDFDDEDEEDEEDEEESEEDDEAEKE